MNRMSWDDYFGALVQVISMRSNDENTKVGAIIVDQKNRIVATGYNGTPRGTTLPTTRPEKYPYMVHAEENAMLFAQGDLEGCRIYILGMTPCNVCTRMMVQKGIKEVIVVNPIVRSAGADWNFDATFKMAEQSGMIIRNINTPFVTIERELDLDC